MKIYNKNKCVFEGVGCIPDECKIELESNAKPFISSARRIPLKIRDKLKDSLDFFLTHWNSKIKFQCWASL